MNALASPAAVARTRPPPTGRRAPAAAAPRRLLAPPVLATPKKAAAAPVASVSLTKGTEAERNRAAGLVLQGLLKQESARDEAVTKLLAQVAKLESRVQQLEKAAAAQAPQPAEQMQKAASQSNRAEQLNPGCKAYWKSRGYTSPPWKSNDFLGTRLLYAHNWPTCVEKMQKARNFSDVPTSLWWQQEYDQRASAALKKIFNDRNVVDR